MDYLKVVLIGGGIAAGVALLATFTVVAANLCSKSLVLAASMDHSGERRGLARRLVLT